MMSVAAPEALAARHPWVTQLQIPVTEGPRYKIGEVAFSGNTVVKTEGLRPLFKIDKDEWFNEKKIRSSLQPSMRAASM